MSLSATSAAMPVAKPARLIPESIFREVVAADPDFASSYMLELLNQLQACGISGQILRVFDYPTLALPDLRGLYLLVRNIEPVRGCISKHWRGLDSPAFRNQLRRLVNADTKVMVALQSFWPFHSVYFDLQQSVYGQELAQVTVREKPSAKMVVLGRQFLFDDVNEDEPRPFAADLLKLANLDLDSGFYLELTKILARANRAELIGQTRQNLSASPAPDLNGALEIRSYRPFRKPAILRMAEIEDVVKRLAQTRPALNVRRQLAAVLERHLHPRDFGLLAPHLGFGSCSDLLH